MSDDAGGMPRLGDVLGDYRLLHVAGEGASSWVFAAEHVEARRPVALKVLRPDAPEAAAQRFHDEERLLARVRHPHVVEHVATGAEGAPCPWFAMELLKGRRLRELYDWEGVGGLERAVDIAAQLAVGLAAAHAAGLVHGDVRPENVMLVHRRGRRDFVKLIDFGFAALGGGSRRVVARRPEDVLGTPEYSAPELLAGRDYDQRADVYAFGVVLYELLTGALPFSTDTFDALVIAQLTMKPAAASTRVAAVSPRLDTLVARCLEKAPANRPRMPEVAAELLALAPACGAAPSRRRLRRLAVVLAGGVLGATALVSLALGEGSRWLRRLLDGL